MEEKVYAPLTERLVQLGDVLGPTFSEKIMGSQLFRQKEWYGKNERKKLGIPFGGHAQHN
ncbi:PTS glucose transporter subunit IIA [Oceanobacillus alkalisoli]|uniref:PTS glucose transporter subunit IIA n=1 Tax=Oceanobacillus alkalisoli TaxID=2925113 RepID=UPI001EE4CA80|nr:PTS glucose transporter subunit IIA [Oceanobacillus alkalisoli]MCG5104809.1 PTS glucose transporter subunit IIA [Oceanobacillus alkalisoli]